MLPRGRYPQLAVRVGASRAGEAIPNERGARPSSRAPPSWFGPSYGCVTVSPVTIASVLCANRTPYTPSVDLSFPAATSSDFG